MTINPLRGVMLLDAIVAAHLAWIVPLRIFDYCLKLLGLVLFYYETMSTTYTQGLGSLVYWCLSVHFWVQVFPDCVRFFLRFPVVLLCTGLLLFLGMVISLGLFRFGHILVLSTLSI